MRGARSFAFCAFGLAVAVGVRLWMDVRDSMSGVSEQAPMGDVDEPLTARPLRTSHDSTVNVAHRTDRVAHGSHIGEYLDPQADYVPRGAWEPKHVGDRLDPEAPLDFGGDRVVSHIGEHLDPDDDWLRPSHDAPRHIGERVEPDFPPLVEPSASHLGERIEPPGEE